MIETAPVAGMAEAVSGDDLPRLLANASVADALHAGDVRVVTSKAVDSSNFGPGGTERVLLLAGDCDAASRALADGLERRCGIRAAVIVSDSFVRPWRHGAVNVTLGCDGLPALADHRGAPDRQRAAAAALAFARELA